MLKKLMDMEIYELTRCDDAVCGQMEVLMRALSARCTFSAEKLRAVIDDNNSVLLVASEGGRIVGCATLCVFHSPTGAKASVEDVVVDEEYRGRGLGRELMLGILERARRLAPIELHLTSKPARVAANALYQSLGFVHKETNAYTLCL